jgi:hypothetical protein
LAEPAADAFGSDVRAGFGAGEQPRVGGVLVLVSQQCGEPFRDGDGVLAEAEVHDVVLVDLEVGGAESDDAGDELAVEQQQRSGDPGRRLDLFVVQKRAGLSEACGVIDRRLLVRAGGRAMCSDGRIPAVCAQSRNARVGNARLGGPVSQWSS